MGPAMDAGKAGRFFRVLQGPVTLTSRAISGSPVRACS
jgi:hypothetical protein